jgi:hypothetical protein
MRIVEVWQVIAKTDSHDVVELIVPGAPGPGRCVLNGADRDSGTVKLKGFGLIRGHKKLSAVPTVTWIEHHDSLLGGGLRRLRALEMLLQQMPDQARCGGTALAFGIELEL